MDALMALAEHQLAQRYRESGLNSFCNGGEFLWGGRWEGSVRFVRAFSARLNRFVRFVPSKNERATGVENSVRSSK
jgi:hypothetical protein